jgi:rhodanese-related sulfurtransferase
MRRERLRTSLLVGALIIALAGAALGARTNAVGLPPLSAEAPAAIAPFDLARLLSQAPPDVVVIKLDDARHALLGAVPLSAYGADDDQLVKAAPKARGIVLVGKDPVRVDRLARQLMATGRKVRVLEGGLAAWDRVMKDDPPAPPLTAGYEAQQRHREEVALRRYFGDSSAAPPPAVEAPAAPMLAAPTKAKKREGC